MHKLAYESIGSGFRESRATWALVRARYDDPEKTAAVRRFLVWALAEGQSDAEALRYIPLPANVVRAALAEAESLGR